MKFLGRLFVFLVFFQGKNAQVDFDSVHEGFDKLLEKGVE